MTPLKRLGAAAFVAGIIVVAGISQRSTTQGDKAHGQVVQSGPLQGATGAAGTNGTNGTNATVEQAKVLTTASDGTMTWTYPTAYGAGVVPVLECVAVGAGTTTQVSNCQIDPSPTNTQAKFRVTTTNITVVALLGLSILSVPASPGATVIHVTARAPTP